MKKRLFSLMFLILLISNSVGVCAVETTQFYPIDYAWEQFWYDEPAEETIAFTGELNVKSALLMESSTGTVLYAFNENEHRQIASVTKIMSTLLVMEAIAEERIALEDMVTVSERAASMGGSQVFLEPGEQMSVNEMLKALIVVSANDATLALAEHICGSEETFIAAMNERAQALGMKDTHFANTNGLDIDNHYSSANDVAIMTRELLKHELIFNYTTIWMDTIRDGAFGLANTNKLVRFYSGANGMKTGFTTEAKYCLSGTAKRDGLQLIAVVLGGETSQDRFEAAKKLLDFGFANVSAVKPEKLDMQPIEVKGGVENLCEIDYEPPTLLLNKGDAKRLRQQVELAEYLDAPVEKGKTVGYVSYYLDEELLDTAAIHTCSEIEKIGFLTIFTRIWRNIFGFM